MTALLILVPILFMIAMMWYVSNKHYKTVNIEGVGSYRVHSQIYNVIQQQAEMIAGYEAGFEKIEKKTNRQAGRKGLHVTHRK